MIETSVRHRSEVAARLIYLPQISHTAFWEFCNRIEGQRTCSGDATTSAFGAEADSGPRQTPSAARTGWSQTITGSYRIGTVLRQRRQSRGGPLYKEDRIELRYITANLWIPGTLS